MTPKANNSYSFSINEYPVENCLLATSDSKSSAYVAALYKYLSAANSVQDFSAAPGSYAPCEICGCVAGRLNMSILNPVLFMYSTGDFSKPNIDPDIPYVTRINSFTEDMHSHRLMLNSITDGASFVFPNQFKIPERLAAVLDYVGSIQCTQRGESPDLHIGENIARHGKKKAITFYYKRGCFRHGVEDINWYLRAVRNLLPANEVGVAEDLITLLFYESINEIFHAQFFLPIIQTEYERHLLRNIGSKENCKLTIPVETLLRWSEIAMSRILNGICKETLKILTDRFSDDTLCPNYLFNVAGKNVVRWYLS